MAKLGSGSEGATNLANATAASDVHVIDPAMQTRWIAPQDAVYGTDGSAVSARGPPTRTEHPHSPVVILAKEPNLP